MEEVLTEKEGVQMAKPPITTHVRFCLTCGRNDAVVPLSDRHWTGGKLCSVPPVRLEYALVDAEHTRLEKAVIEAAKKWVGFYNGSSEFFSDTKLADEINALIEFESNQQQVKR